jgi:hypothetical protein
MSVRVESPSIRGSINGPIVIAIIVALGIGLFAGTVITKAVDDRPAAVATPVGAQFWDDQKLQAMQGRAMAERYRSEEPLAWDARKLEAMAGRVLAAGVGAEDPPVRPHLPNHPPKG